MKTSSAVLSGICLCAWSLPGLASVIEDPVVGRPAIRSINVIRFAPEGVLLIGDGTGAQIFAVETDDLSAADPLSGKIEGIDRRIAGHLGTPPEGIEILDMAVNPASGRTYVAVRRQDDKSHLVLTVDGGGRIREFEMDEVRHARVDLSIDEARMTLVTDVAWADDRLIAAGRSNEEFASKIFSIPAPLKHESSSGVFSAETYHVSHRRWETKAPMSVLIPFRENGKMYVVGAFSCTPVVKYPLEALQPGGRVKGTSVLELGSGNRPLDMFVYEKDGRNYVLANTFRFHHERRPFGPSPYWTVKFDQDILAEQESVNEDALRRLSGTTPATDRVQMVEAYHGVMHMAKLNDRQAVVLRDNGDGISLEVLPLP